jgi:hypothetical protein
MKEAVKETTSVEPRPNLENAETPKTERIVMSTNTTHPISPKAPSREHLQTLLETHRQVFSELYAGLRSLLAKEASLEMSPPPQAFTRRVQQLEKAFELHRQAEAKIELLIGGPL